MLYHKSGDLVKYSWTCQDSKTGIETTIHFTVPVDRKFFKNELKKRLKIKKLSKTMEIF